MLTHVTALREDVNVFRFVWLSWFTWLKHTVDLKMIFSSEEDYLWMQQDATNIRTMPNSCVL